MNKTNLLRDATRNGTIKKVLVIRNGLLGDAVFITPVFRRLHATLPAAQIDFVTSVAAIPLFQFSSLRNIYGLASTFSLWKHIRLFSSLRKEKYDLVLVQELNTHYTIMAALTGAKFIVGFENSVSFLLDISYQRKEDTHAVNAELDSVKEWTKAPGNNDITELIVIPEEQKEVDILLNQHGIGQSDILVCIHIGTSGQNSERTWILERYAELADKLIVKENVKIIFTGIDKDKNDINDICSRMKNKSANLVGILSLRQLMAILQRSRIVIGPDTGTLHIANAVGTPVIMLMGFADKNHTGAFGKNSTIIYKNLSCIGCSRRKPVPAQWEICKTLRPVVCMDQITVDDVYHSATKYLQNGNILPENSN